MHQVCWQLVTWKLFNFRLSFLRVQSFTSALGCLSPKQFFSRHSIVVTSLCSLEMPKDELPNHNCIKHLRSVVQQQQTRIAELEKTSAEHKHQLAEQVFISFPLSNGQMVYGSTYLF